MMICIMFYDIFLFIIFAYFNFNIIFLDYSFNIKKVLCDNPTHRPIHGSNRFEYIFQLHY